MVYREIFREAVEILAPNRSRFPIILKTGWWLSHPSEKYDFVSWDHDIHTDMESHKKLFQTTNQSLITINQHH